MRRKVEPRPSALAAASSCSSSSDAGVSDTMPSAPWADSEKRRLACASCATRCGALSISASMMCGCCFIQASKARASQPASRSTALTIPRADGANISSVRRVADSSPSESSSSPPRMPAPRPVAAVGTAFDPKSDVRRDGATWRRDIAPTPPSAG
eukprot:scaffold95369_cov25-Tisochrysis_lutea.AAC.4